MKYLALHSGLFDLGIFQYALYEIMTFYEFERLFFGHAQPLMLLWSLLYNILPESLRTITLLSVQALLLSVPVALLWRFYGRLPALAYALYFGVWYNGLFDFHMDHMVVPLLFGFFIATDRKKISLSVLLALSVALVKEPFALQTAACGIYLMLICHRILAGIFLIAASAFYFYFVTHFAIPLFTFQAKGALSIDAFSWMGTSLSEIIIFIVTNPREILSEIILNPGKQLYLLAVFGSLGFISLLRPAALLIALPVLMISMLSRSENYYWIWSHYTAGLIAPLIVSFAKGLPVAERIWTFIRLPKKSLFIIVITGIIGCHFLLSPSPISRLFFQSDPWTYNYRVYIPTDRDKMIKQAMYEHIPKNREIAVSTQNNINWGHLAHRRYYFSFPEAVLKPTRLPDWMVCERAESQISGKQVASVYADYVVLDLKRPWFVVDKACEWSDGRCQDGKITRAFQDAVAETMRCYKTVFMDDDFYILKRGKTPTNCTYP